MSLDIDKDKKQPRITSVVTNNPKSPKGNSNDDLDIKTQNFIQTCI
jgi:hypothetical protein